MSEVFNSVFTGLADISITNFLACVGTALAAGLFVAFMYTLHTKASRSFMATIAMLPALVCVVILLVNGNIAAGVAVTGAFSLVRFRSAQGNAKEIAAIFLSMATGLIIGMGYLLFGAIFAVIISLAFIVFSKIRFGGGGGQTRKTLVVTIPENLDYTHIFDDIFERHTKSHELAGVKTTNMGSLFKLSYDVELKDTGVEKKMIDEIRERNGNLEISVNRFEVARGEL